MVLSPVQHKEARNSRRESYDQGKYTVMRRFVDVPYGDRFRFITDIVGGFQNLDGNISVRNPDKDPFIPFVFGKRILGITGYPFIKDLPAGEAGYDKCFVDAEYATPDDVSDDSNEGADVLYEEISIDFQTNFVDIPSRFYKFKGTEVATDKNVGRLLGGLALTIDRKFVPTLPFDLYQATLGRVNKRKFKGLDKGKVLFSAVRARRAWYLTTLPPNTVSAFDISLQFSWREEEWNKAPFPNTGKFEELVSQVGGDSVYEASDRFDELLRFGISVFPGGG